LVYFLWLTLKKVMSGLEVRNKSCAPIATSCINPPAINVYIIRQENKFSNLNF
jgi:hypothetical protein